MPQPPALEFFATLAVTVAVPIDLGPEAAGHRRLVPITGGTFTAASGAHGTVLPGGADDQVLVGPSRTDLHAVYVVELADGARIGVTNTGVRSGDPAAIARLVRGETVAPDAVYFRSWPRLTSSDARWSWLGEKLFVGVGTREPDRVLLDVFRVM